MTLRLAWCLLPTALIGCSGQGASPPTTDNAVARSEAPEARASAAEPCEITGESTDPDPRGLRVHAEPGLASREVGRLYPGIDPESYFHEDQPSDAQGLVGAQFTIDGVAGDWLHITDIDPVTDGVVTGEPNLNFQGSGWVHASKVRLIFTTVAAHQRPDANSPLVPGARFSNGEEARYLLDCRGPWAKLEYVPAEGSGGGSRIEAWLLSESNREHADIMRNSLDSEGGAR